MRLNYIYRTQGRNCFKKTNVQVPVINKTAIIAETIIAEYQ